MSKHSITYTPTPTRKQYQQHNITLQQSNKSSNLIGVRKFYDIDYIFDEPSMQMLTHRNPRVSAPKIRTIDSCSKELEKNVQVYKNMLINLQMDCLYSKQLPKHQPGITLNQRAEVIHSRKSSRHSFSQKRSHKRSTSQTSPGGSSNKTMNHSRTIDPQAKEVGVAPQAKTMKLALKSESVPRIDPKEQQALFCKQPMKSQPQSPKRRFWAKTYRPWSPLKKSALGLEEFCNLEQFVQIDI